MNARDLVRQGAARLAAAGVDSPEVDASTLLCHVLAVPRTTLLLVDEVADADAEAYLSLVERRAGRVPLQHLTGVAHFRTIELAVGPGVFVPRPETEVLVGWAVEQAHDVLASGRRPRVVDLCTGSGAVALAVATEVPEAEVHAVELSDDAVVWAQRNLAGSQVDLRHGDMAEAFHDLDGTVDVVVANPPYIPLDAFESVALEAREHDPSTALWSGSDGLEALRVVERVAARLLRPGGAAGTEHADVQGESVPALFVATGLWTQVRDHPDLAGRPRFTTAVLARCAP